ATAAIAAAAAAAGARLRIQSTLEAGQYFGESGILHRLGGPHLAALLETGAGGIGNSGGGGGGGGAGCGTGGTGTRAVREQFAVVAGTTLEVLTLRQRHYGIVDASTLQTLAANFAARTQWRRVRKLEARRGRAVLRAAKEELRAAAAAGAAADEDQA
ncbi:unnamed protein product, partial [Phaeothamnion confervicola]